ncbi:hypothetical protein C1646_768161 [Rhizophagus diaphanus]|nr:hypothetical protein C1646_768161 [Rhizophagus diaphanus] [Rhizophagus sp. MUCL 43196]
MASPSTTKHIQIDWSTSSIHSFVRLGEPSTPSEDSYLHGPNIKPQVILFTKDILSVDIDDILSSSTYIVQRSVRKNFPLLVSLRLSLPYHEVHTTINTQPRYGSIPVCTVLLYCPVPNIFIPLKYRDIIPPDPIYDNNGQFIIPESREWFTFMKCIIDNIDGEVNRLRYIRLQQELKVEQKLGFYSGDESKMIEKEASYYGTSAKYLNI